MPTSGFLSPIAKFMINYGAPAMGVIVSGLKDEYIHLQKSILDFPPPDEFSELMGVCGLDVFKIDHIGFGAVTLYLAKPRAKQE